MAYAMAQLRQVFYTLLAGMGIKTEGYVYPWMKIHKAHDYLVNDRLNWASNRERGYFLPEHNESLDILRKAAKAL